MILMVASLIALSPAAALAHDAHAQGGQGHGVAIEGGAPGKATEATRTVNMVATDSDFAPRTVAVKSSESVRFVVRNDGKLVHEFTIGTKVNRSGFVGGSTS